MEKIDIKDLAEKVKSDQEKINIIDVRPADYYEKGHIPNALHMPYSQIEDRLDELNKDEHYYTICQDGKGAKKSAELLDKQGFKVTRVTQGMPDYPGETVTN